MWTASLLAKQGKIPAEAFVEVVHRHLMSRQPIGRIALRERLLTVKQLVEILEDQATSSQPFGVIAVKLGYITESQVALLLMKQLGEATPIDDLLVECGALTAEELNAEKKQLNREFTVGADDSGASVDGELLSTGG